MRRFRAVSPRALLPFLVPALPLALRAMEEGGHGGGGSDFAGKVVNFIILFGGLFILLRKPVAGLLAKRTAEIRASIAEAREARESAERLLAEAKARIAALEDEISRVRRDAEEEAERERARIRAAAEAEAERLRRLADQEIDAQLRSGMRDLKAYAAGLAASLAETHLKDKLTAADQAALIDRSIDRIKGLHEERRPR